MLADALGGSRDTLAGCESVDYGGVSWRRKLPILTRDACAPAVVGTERWNRAREPGTPRKGAEAWRAETVPAPCTHRPSLGSRGC